MRLEIKGLAELRERLGRLRAEEVMRSALAEQAERLASAVRDQLSEPPGAGEHDRPWLRSGALRDSVGAQTDGLEAAIGSSDPAAAPQEMGTSRIPPRPFLAPIAASMGEGVARSVGAKVAAALRGEASDDSVIELSGGGGLESAPPRAGFAATIRSDLKQNVRQSAQTSPNPALVLVGDIGSDLEKLGGGVPRLVPTQKGATQFIFPNGMVLRFDLQPGQHLRGQGPHINLEYGGKNIHIPLE